MSNDGCNAGVAAVSAAGTGGRASGKYYHLTGGSTALRNYLGLSVTAMSYLAGSTQLTLHLQSQPAAAAAQHAAAEAAAAVEAACIWQVHLVRHVSPLECYCCMVFFLKCTR
jgi:hypothetical protein